MSYIQESDYCIISISDNEHFDFLKDTIIDTCFFVLSLKMGQLTFIKMSSDLRHADLDCFINV